MGWQTTCTCGSQDYITAFSYSSPVRHTRVGTLCSTTLMFTVTSLTSSSISVTFTVHTHLCCSMEQELHVVVIHKHWSFFLVSDLRGAANPVCNSPPHFYLIVAMHLLHLLPLFASERSNRDTPRYNFSARAFSYTSVKLFLKSC